MTTKKPLALVDQDHEFYQLEIIVRAMLDLSPNAHRRIMAYLLSRFGNVHPTFGPPPSS